MTVVVHNPSGQAVSSPPSSTTVTESQSPAGVEVTSTAGTVVEQAPGPGGLSAYELALREGFVGTLSEWLASLKGEPGAPGSAGFHLEFIQVAPAAQWTWVHGLNSRPAIQLFRDSDPNTPVYTDVEYPDLNTVVITWPTPETGRAYI